jgi:zinc protease
MKHYKECLTALGLLLLFHTPSINAQNVILPLDPKVRTGKLANGFTYFIRHNEEPKNRVVMYLVNKVGSILEDEDQRGLAHFMEHMSFNGTKHFPKNELVDYLQKSGVRFGADLNAYTSFDETVYQLPLPSDQPALLAGGLNIMRDWAQEALLDSIEINKERGVVLEEKRLGKGASERMQRVYWPVVFQNSRYAVRIPIGLDSVLNNFKPETIRRFYHDWYRPDLQALVIVGDINVDEMEKRVRALFSNLKNPASERKRINYSTPVNGKNQFVAVTDNEMTSTAIEVLIKQPELQLKTYADFRANLIRDLYNQMLSERYSEIIQQANPPFLEGNAGFSGFLGGLDSYTLSVNAKPGELETGFKATWRVSEQLRRFGFTGTELARAKKYILTSLQSALKESSKTNSETFANAYQSYFLNGTVETGIQKENSLTARLSKNITLSDVNGLAKNLKTDKNRDIIILAPEKDKAILPDENKVLGWINSVDAESMIPFTDDVSALPLLKSNPVKGKIISESTDKELGILTLKLNNHVTILIKPTNFKNDEILFTGFSPGGSSVYPDEQYSSAAVAGQFIPAFGAGNYTNIQLRKYLSDKRVAVSPYINDRVQGISGSSSSKDLKTALQLLFAFYTEPRKDTALFKGFIDDAKASIANRENDPSSVFHDTVSALLYHNSPRKTGPSIKKIDDIDLNRVYGIYLDRFSNAGGSVFTFVGNIDTTAIKPLLEQYLGGLPNTGKSDTAKDLGLHLPEGLVTKNVYKGTEPKATVQLLWSGTFNYDQQNNLIADALKECLEIRLLERLREDESGVYTPSASVSASKYPQSRFVFSVAFGCAPQNADKLINSALDEIEKLKSKGPLAINLQKWKAETLRQQETQLLSNQWWEIYLSSQILNHENLNAYKNFNAIVNDITPAQVQEAAKRLLSGKNYIRLELLPESAAGIKR